MPLRLSIVELRFTISQLSKQHDSKHPCGASWATHRSDRRLRAHCTERTGTL